MNVLKYISELPIRFGGEVHAGWLPPKAASPPPTPLDDVLLSLQICDADSGFILEWWDEGKRYVGDTWHESINDALAQAEQWFGITADQWKDGNPQQ